ncbi:uncharacterized protein LOC110707584 [Chenopodium quinoa]|uniref:uncharacterized protein LOC110707584 n=1 Tax=Chenopodium quinoa TaxID=63459 RepID=UPI000B790704|nr:uncharacterized protein LOC110707584 [Chenopodium quinoa]
MVDYDSLIDKMLVRLHCWSSRNLSYAARVTLINVVLMSLHTYWAQCVLLPKSVIDRINQLCRAFLWSGNDVLSITPPIAWDWFADLRRQVVLELEIAGSGTKLLPPWDGISSLGAFSGPWLVVGDFNSVLNSYDNINGNAVTDYEGHGDTRIATRIDWGLVNQAWLNKYSHVESIYLPSLLSDHNPLLAKNLKDLNTKYFANVDEKVDVALASLKAIQDHLAVDYSNSDLHVKQAEAVNMVKHWMYIQESIYKQKSRVDWNKLGDSSSHYFFSVMKHRQGRNKIDSIFIEDDVLLKDPMLIENEIVGFYKGLLGSSASYHPVVDLATIRRGSQLSSSSIDILTSVVTTYEIDNALAQIRDDKAPGIYGFNVVFFKKAWPMIKTDIYAAIFFFFETGVIAKQWNCTTITLVPKVQHPSYVKKFRPIAYCTMLYKLISKVLTKRISKVVGTVINDAQAGFIPGKHISDNILLATELIKGYSHKFVSPRCMIKIDLRKAYDFVEWPFLQTVLEELGFPHSVVKWIMTCVCFFSYSVMVNCFPDKPFFAKKGLRQGDPMSPFLFALCKEYLSRFLKEMTWNPNFNYYPRCEKLGITHMMFADDLLLFSRADSISIQLLLLTFQKFSCASRLMANLSKSEVYFGGISDFDKDQLQTVLGVTARLDAGLLDTYLMLAGFSLSKVFSLNTYAKKAPVSWHHMTLPKVCGGWNITSLGDWNKAAICKVLWDLAHKSDNIDIIDDIGGWSSIMKNGKMSIAKLYARIRPQAPKVGWKRIVCNNQAAPKSIFITWLSLLDKFATKDRIVKWNANVREQTGSCFYFTEFLVLQFVFGLLFSGAILVGWQMVSGQFFAYFAACRLLQPVLSSCFRSAIGCSGWQLVAWVALGLHAVLAAVLVCCQTISCWCCCSVLLLLFLAADVAVF